MVKEARQGHEAMLKGYEDQCKEKKVSLLSGNNVLILRI